MSRGVQGDAAWSWPHLYVAWVLCSGAVKVNTRLALHEASSPRSCSRTPACMFARVFLFNCKGSRVCPTTPATTIWRCAVCEVQLAVPAAPLVLKCCLLSTCFVIRLAAAGWRCAAASTMVVCMYTRSIMGG